MSSDESVNNGHIIDLDSSSEDDFSDPDAATYYRNISLRHFAADPLKMLTNHAQFKELCLQNGNPEAHYIEGLLQYFCKKDKHTGLYHLRKSSTGKYSNGTFLYGVLMIVHGQYNRGRKHLDKLKWQEDLSTSDLCWRRIKNSLRKISVAMTSRLYENIINLRPYPMCHRDNDMVNVCNRCYYYKRADQWFEFATKDM